MLVPVVPLLLMLAGQAPPPQTAPAPSPAPARPQSATPKLYNETADARAQIEAALKAAAEDDIRVLINWGANDDEACATFQKEMSGRGLNDPAHETIRTKLSNEYRSVRVDVGRLDKNLNLAAAYGVTLSAGSLPHLTVLDKQGKVLAQQPGPQFAAAPGAPAVYDAEKIAAFLKQHQVPPVAADPLLAAALADAKRDGKYVFLWFSAPW